MAEIAQLLIARTTPAQQALMAFLLKQTYNQVSLMVHCFDTYNAFHTAMLDTSQRPDVGQLLEKGQPMRIGGVTAVTTTANLVIHDDTEITEHDPLVLAHRGPAYYISCMGLRSEWFTKMREVHECLALWSTALNLFYTVIHS